jgi:hypothetical protein
LFYLQWLLPMAKLEERKKFRQQQIIGRPPNNCSKADAGEPLFLICIFIGGAAYAYRYVLIVQL